MKNIIKTCKHSISAILTLCMILGIAGTCVNVAAMAAETTATVEETTATTEAIAPELMPMMASGCGDLQSWYNIDHATKALILGDVSGNWQHKVGNNPNIYYNGAGMIVLCGTGSYSGRTYVTDLERAWYL